MKNWTPKRKISLAVHAAFVAVPLAAGTISALIFWGDWFGDWRFAVPIVASVELVAFVGLLLHLTAIDSPLARLRHLLPLVSIGPLSYEVYKLLAHNGPVVAGLLTAFLATVAATLVRQCFGKIEELCTATAVELAVEQARAKLEPVAIALASSTQTVELVNGYLAAWGATLATRPALPAEQPAADAPRLTDTATVLSPEEAERVAVLRERVANGEKLTNGLITEVFGVTKGKSAKWGRAKEITKELTASN